MKRLLRLKLLLLLTLLLLLLLLLGLLISCWVLPKRSKNCLWSLVSRTVAAVALLQLLLLQLLLLLLVELLDGLAAQLLRYLAARGAAVAPSCRLRFFERVGLRFGRCFAATVS